MMKKLAGHRPKKIWLDIVIILFTFVAVVASITAIAVWKPGFVRKWPDTLQFIFGIVTIFGPIFAFVGVVAWRVQKPRETPFPLRLRPLASMRRWWLPWSCVMAIINTALILELVFIKSPAKVDWVQLTILADFVFVAITIFLIPILIKQIRYRKIFDRAPGNAVASIRNLHMEEHFHYDEDGRYSTSYSYHAVLEFSPKLATNTPEKMVVEALISEDLYYHLKVKDFPFVDIRYAAENPRIFLIEGE